MGLKIKKDPVKSVEENPSGSGSSTRRAGESTDHGVREERDGYQKGETPEEGAGGSRSHREGHPATFGYFCPRSREGPHCSAEGGMETVGEILAWRVFGVTVPMWKREPILISPQWSILWWGPNLSAEGSPALEGRDGIYAYPSQNDLQEGVCTTLIPAKVSLLGDVVVHTDYFRAQEAQIRELAIPLCRLGRVGECNRPAAFLVQLPLGGHLFVCRECASSLGRRKVFSVEEVREFWRRRYQCEVLPKPWWALRTEWRVGDLRLIFDPEISRDL